MQQCQILAVIADTPIDEVTLVYLSEGLDSLDVDFRAIQAILAWYLQSVTGATVYLVPSNFCRAFVARPLQKVGK